jgi:hypothetical protein
MKPTPLTPELRMAIHVRAELLFDLLTEAKESGASSELIHQLLAEELEAMLAKLCVIQPPERVQAIKDELLVVYDAYRRLISPE